MPRQPSSRALHLAAALILHQLGKETEQIGDISKIDDSTLSSVFGIEACNELMDDPILWDDFQVRLSDIRKILPEVLKSNSKFHDAIIQEFEGIPPKKPP